MTLQLVPANTALVLIDLQHSNAARQLQPHSADFVIANAARLAAAFRKIGAMVVYVRVNIAELIPPNADRPMPRPSAALPANSCEIVDAAGMQAGDVLITKRQWGAFYGTELEQLLRRNSIRTIVLAGIATNFGVESTARVAFDHNYELIFVEDAMSTLTSEMHSFCMTQTFPTMGKVVNTDMMLQALAKTSPN